MINELEHELARHSHLCEQLLHLATQENQALRGAECRPGCYDEQKRDISKTLEESVSSLRRLRALWQQLPAETRTKHPQIQRATRANQELAMKWIVLDRENEQALLRRGLLPPSALRGKGARASGSVSQWVSESVIAPSDPLTHSPTDPRTPSPQSPSPEVSFSHVSNLYRRIQNPEKLKG